MYKLGRIFSTFLTNFTIYKILCGLCLEDGGGGLESHDGGTGWIARPAVGRAVVCVAKVSGAATNMDRSRAHQGIVS